MEPFGQGKFAIVGIGCRMPPNANTLANFWRFLLRGGNALRPHRPDRWDWRQYFDEDPLRPGKTYAPKSASLDADLRQFDPLAFGMSPREAASLDPQQRLLLEVAWEAFEDAGVPLEQISGSATGVFIGGFCLDHLVLQTQPSNRHLINAHSTGGVMMTVLSNRLSHAFNLRGPSLTLDTACSSSLVAIHSACQSLRLHECSMALAGGVNVMSRPEYPIIMSKGHFLSPHGECRAFDDSAAGYARGEGAGVFLLKRHEDAVAAGDPIHAVIRGSGVNQDGHTDGISLPNSAAQGALLREVYDRAGVSPGEVDYVEAHGTGTQAGDPAELRALNANFSLGRQPGSKLLVGSVKTNVGHLEAAAGVAGMLKAIGVLKARQVPKNLHFRTPNPKIPFAEYCLEVACETAKLPSIEEKPTLYVGVNSFGYGGTNAHVLLESAPQAAVPEAASEETKAPRLIPFSAHGEGALRDLAGKFAFQLGQPSGGGLADLAYTAAFRRSHLPVRGVAIATTTEELREQFMAASTGQPHPGIVLTAKGAPTAAAPVFVYTGMGPQWWGMGQELLRGEPIVAAAADEIDVIFRALAGWSIKEAMLAGEGDSRMARTEVAQPANFVLQVALTRWWAAHGVRPAAVVGHSVGEVAAAYAAGVYSLEEAVRVSYHRSRLQQAVAGQGAMLAVGLAEAEALREIGAFPAVSIAAINSFSAVTLSGDKAQLEQIAAALEARGIFQKFLRVEVAYHSPQMEPLREELLAVLGDLAPRPAQIPLYSTAHGGIVPGEAWDAEYWWRNVRHAVRFAGAMQQLLDDGFLAFLEVGPHPVLGNSIKECAAHLERKIAGFSSLRRQEPERARLLLTLSELYCAGGNVDWRFLAPAKGRFVPGPAYPWQRQTYWVESERSRMERLGLPGPVYLNRTVLGPNPCWEVEINRNYFPFLFDHGVQDQTVFAGMGYIEAAIALNQKVHEKPAVVLEHVSFERVLVVDYAKLQYLITEFDAEAGRFAIFSRIEGEEGGAQRHCRGRMRPQVEPMAPTLDLAALRKECAVTVAPEGFYEHLGRLGLHYGPMFRSVVEVSGHEGAFLLRLDIGHVVDADTHPLHPAIFDAALQGVIYGARRDELYVPASFEQFEYFSRPESSECFVFGRFGRRTELQIEADVWLMNSAGEVHAKASRVALQRIQGESAPVAENLLYRLDWQPEELAVVAEVEGERVLILADAADSDMVLAGNLAGRWPGAEVMQAEGEQWRRSLARVDLERRNRLVVLWGSRFVGRDAAAMLALNEKAVAFLQALQKNGANPLDVTFVTRGAKAVEPGEAIGNLAGFSLGALGLVAENEEGAITCRSVDFPMHGDEPAAALLAAEIAAASRGEIAHRAGRRLVNGLSFRERREASEKLVERSLDEAVELKAGLPGKLEGLRYERAERTPPGEGEMEIRVHRVSLNYKDLLKIEGRLHPIALDGTFNESSFGMECAGVVVRAGVGSCFQPGDRVVAMVRDGFRSYATVPEVFAVKIPDNLGMEAAAIPVVYLAAYRGLIDLANLQPGERVLIHHATGGVGLAAVDIARWRGAEIYATAGSEEKRRFLHERGISHIYSSRDLDFAQRIREATQAGGVDVVIGAQTGQAMHASLGLLRSGGRYLEIGKKDIVEDNGLPLRAFNQNLIFASVDMDRLMKEQPAMIQRTLRSIFERFAVGDFQLGPVRCFEAREISAAFLEMARSRHVGKLTVDFSQGQVETVEHPEMAPIIRPEGCYIVTGGTSGFGARTGCWLAEKGAGKVMLVSRSGLQAAGIGEVVQAIEARGAQVEVRAMDVTDPQQVKDLVRRAGDGGFTLCGVMHGAMVLDDALLAELTGESFRRVFRPKVEGALNLAAAVAGLEGLDFLVFYSSVSALVGNRGQTSYVVANSLLDGLAQTLRVEGVPAISINWGSLAESGIVARSEHLAGVLAAAGITGLTDAEAFQAMEEILELSPAQIGAFKLDWARWLEAHPRRGNDPRFHALCAQAAVAGGGDLAAQVRNALEGASREQRLRALEEHLQEVLGGILKMAKDATPLDRRLNEMGVDSLLVLELGLGIEERLGIRFSAMELLKGPTIRQLASLAHDKLWRN